MSAQRIVAMGQLPSGNPVPSSTNDVAFCKLSEGKCRDPLNLRMAAQSAVGEHKSFGPSSSVPLS
jgi:hypothetical protein